MLRFYIRIWSTYIYIYFFVYNIYIYIYVIYTFYIYIYTFTVYMNLRNITNIVIKFEYKIEAWEAYINCMRCMTYQLTYTDLFNVLKSYWPLQCRKDILTSSMSQSHTDLFKVAKSYWLLQGHKVILTSSMW